MKLYMMSKSQARRLKPNMVPGAIMVLGILAVLGGQLMLNMALTHDAYHLRELKIEKRNLATNVQILQEEVDSLGSPQNLADAANQLGMVANPASVLLDIQNDKIYGKPVPADPERSSLASANLVANSAMGTVSEFSLATVASSVVEESVTKATSAGSEVVLVAGLIPASPTR
jgi:hypothetical protein